MSLRAIVSRKVRKGYAKDAKRDALWLSVLGETFAPFAGNFLPEKVTPF